ncbi:hypothetical protein IR155_14145, partial [Microbacterium paludicola]|nr:hypothetical protein [Microbacterium paludicola]
MSIKTWFTETLNPKRWSTRMRVIVASGLVLVLVAAGVIAAFALRPGPSET